METQFGLCSRAAFRVHRGLFCYTVSVTEGSSNPGARLVSARSPYSQPLGLLGPEDRLCDLAPKAPAPGVGLSTPLHASVWAGKLLVPLLSWVTAPVFCVETLTFSLSGALRLPIRPHWNHLIVSHSL